MRNFLTIEVESYTGGIFMSLLAVFFIGFIFIAMKNLDSDVAVINSEQVQVKTISATERVLIQNWIRENEIKIPEEVGYRYLVGKYPSRPWLK
ncbi:MAG: hypothetical protein A2651_01590 [Candidatus Yanofskybacteria bacterium RIFCSPHIGHO2_01_FULL_42_12]|uniref:Uncharacterized protein n=1 Tax=Candidatus Yanofskybacteria bacterium RIFCSPLOWO2_01_FULL_42_49 TaxID=1802694 RepID=A0A1F8GA42_9BACT|nr:MAG: hypothetical protein A2651_01590 [Candidatus Yanofskybacteria bacterium RIFCSPHIGHO2_01_FULL_42_12]OGN22234.1 MAG: hypothetical protein A2918_02500 [Candidatus Yanofskybacteria bacterium RIFCSPLOWO2_01_FULL_42_49]